MAKKLLIALALIPVWLVAGELLARLVFRLQGEPYSASATRQELLDLQSALSGPVPGLDDGPRAQATDKDVTISLHKGQEVVPLPEGSRYLGFIFSRAATPARAEAAVREAHRHLQLVIR